MYEEEYQKALQTYTFWTNVVSEYDNVKANGLGDHFPECVYRAYILTGNVAASAKLLNDSNYFLPGVYGDKKYQSSDISKIIDSEDISDQKLQSITRQLLEINRNKSSRYH